MSTPSDAERTREIAKKNAEALSARLGQILSEARERRTARIAAANNVIPFRPRKLGYRNHE